MIRFRSFLAALTAAFALPLFAQGDDPRAATNEDPGHPWGVMCFTGDCYDARGAAMGVLTRIGSLKAGTVVEYMSSKKIGEDTVWTCKVLKDRQWQALTVVVREDDFVRCKGTYAEMTDREKRDALIDFCVAYDVWAEDFDRMNEEWEKTHTNPHQEEYETAKAEWDELQESISKNMAVEQASNGLGGGPAVSRNARGAALKNLNELRIEQKTIEKKFLPIKAKWEAWETAHANDPSEPTPTPRMQELAAKMKPLMAAVDALAPGLFPDEIR